MHLLYEKGIYDFTENMSSITDNHQNYERCEYKVKLVINNNR